MQGQGSGQSDVDVTKLLMIKGGDEPRQDNTDKEEGDRADRDECPWVIFFQEENSDTAPCGKDVVFCS